MKEVKKQKRFKAVSKESGEEIFFDFGDIIAKNDQIIIILDIDHKEFGKYFMDIERDYYLYCWHEGAWHDYERD